ncbi:NUMOD4 domain-containing protein [Priestia megaterium]|uniref:NUMOD4 domain-containing protein n=1 Tax=Priestia megaterium TaxID=1404 RepID=UPI0039EB1ECC
MNGKEDKWKKFEEIDGRKYYISTAGRVKSVNKYNDKEYLMKPSKLRNGYRTINLNQGQSQYYVHRLVAEAFIPNTLNKPTVNHINGVDAGDGVDNLEWMTYAEQDEHARKTGLKTSGATPMIALDSNGEVIAQHDTTTEALSCYDGKQLYYNKDVQIIGNVILMKQAYYNTLYKSELNEDMFTNDGIVKEDLFVIIANCFNQMMKYAYVVDGQLIDDGYTTGEVVGCNKKSVSKITSNKWKSIIKGHDVSRVSNMVNGAIDKTYVSDMEANSYKEFNKL